jgi:hypothetical protein
MTAGAAYEVHHRALEISGRGYWNRIPLHSFLTKEEAVAAMKEQQSRNPGGTYRVRKVREKK